MNELKKRVDNSLNLSPQVSSVAGRVVIRMSQCHGDIDGTVLIAYLT